jgi:hypothetical protein
MLFYLGEHRIKIFDGEELRQLTDAKDTKTVFSISPIRLAIHHQPNDRRVFQQQLDLTY